MVPNSDNMKLDLFADTDFAGLYSMEECEAPVSVKSRTGLLLNFGDVPIFWSSKIQTKIALPTLEAEYIALSQGMMELVATRRLVLEMCYKIHFSIKSASTVSCTWDDNVGTQNLASSKGTLICTRTKYIGVKYHWFRSKIQDGIIEVRRFGTKAQQVEILRKGLTILSIEQVRKLVMG